MSKTRLNGRRVGIHTDLISSDTRSAECDHLPVSEGQAQHTCLWFLHPRPCFPRPNIGCHRLRLQFNSQHTTTLSLTTAMADLIDDAEIDFDRAASAFPDISLDGDSDFPDFSSPPSHIPAPAGPFDLDAFGGPTPTREVRVTGRDADDEIGKFESEFPELEVPQVRCGNHIASMLCPCHVRLKAHKTRILMTTTAGSQPTPLSTHIWCSSSFCAAPTAVSSLGNSNLKPTNRRGGA